MRSFQAIFLKLCTAIGESIKLWGQSAHSGRVTTILDLCYNLLHIDYRHSLGSASVFHVVHMHHMQHRPT